MKEEQTKTDTLNISREKLVAMFSRLIGGTSANPNPDEPRKPGPWDPVIRKVANQVFGPDPVPRRWFRGPEPDPWHSEFNLTQLILSVVAERRPELYDFFHNRLNRVALNPQPLPPRWAFIAAFAEEAVDRILLMQEVADAINQAGEQRGIIIVGGKIASLVDEFCGNGIHIPVPRPKHVDDNQLSGIELILAGAVIEQNAAVAHEGLRRELSHAAAKLIETGIARM